MKVLHVIPSVSVVHGGPSMALRSFEQALAARGVEVETATTDDDGPGRHLRVALGAPVRERTATRWYFRKSTEFYKVSWSFFAWIVREVRRFDLVHIHGLFSFTSLATAWAARRAGVPYVIRPLGSLARYGIEERRPLLKRLSLRWIEGPMLRNAAVVQFTSAAERDEALALGAAFSHEIIPLGFETAPDGNATRAFERYPAVRDGTRLVFLSRIDPKKNLEGLIRALGILGQTGIRPYLLVAGGGSESHVQTLKSVAESQGVSGQILWLGHVSGDVKADLLAIADIFVLPSYSENFGIAVVEALFAGVPCVVGRGVALSADVQEAGAGVAVGTDPDSIAAGIRSYCQSAQARSEASASARRLAQARFSVDRMGSRLLELYGRIGKKRIDRIAASI